MRVHPALRVPAPTPVAVPLFELDVELVGVSRQTMTIAAASPGAAINEACARIRASTTFRGAIVCHGHRITE